MYIVVCQKKFLDIGKLSFKNIKSVTSHFIFEKKLSATVDF